MPMVILLILVRLTPAKSLSGIFHSVPLDRVTTAGSVTVAAPSTGVPWWLLPE
jgi:hypothetical protein